MSTDRLESLLAEYAELEATLADPAIHADQNAARRVGRRFAELTPIHKTATELALTRADLAAARELAAEDEAFGIEADELANRVPVIEEKLAELLIPRDINDAKDVILEIKAGEGGEESALFAGDLLRMYLRYAERHGWLTEVLDSQESDLGGFKDVAVAIKTKGVPDSGYGVWSRLKWEGGVHRVQRVPATESQGRIHTSAAGVLVTPEAEETELTIDQNDLRIDVFRSSGPGGQSVNTTDSAVRITHLPTGIVVSCQNERSQLQNKDRAMRMLRSRLLQHAQEEAAVAASDARRAQVRTVDRSERIRTYNYPQNRLSDHRIGYTAYNLDLALAGDMDGVLDALTDADRLARLAGDTELTPEVIRVALNAATAALAAAGVQTPRVDAEWIAAHVLGVSRGQLLFTTATPDQAAQISALVARRAERVPLQHLIGAHFYGLELAVGPGVFIPRPETELLVEWGLAHLAADGGPTVVDLCAGSGAIAAAVADNRTDAVVYAVDFSASALMWLSRNVSGLNVHVCHEDVEDPDLLPEIVGRADLVLCNPPYVPAGTEVAPEVAQDPPAAVFAGADGLALMPAVIAAARRLLKPGGYVGIEHDDSHEAAVPALLAQAGLIEVADHQDLAGRPRFATARQP